MTGRAARVVVAWLLLALIGITSSAAIAGAQGTGAIQGRVVDASGRGILGAQITLAPIGRQVQSDDDGGFTFNLLREGGYVLSVRRVGYRPNTQQIVVGKERLTVSVTLEPVPTILDSVVIRERSSGLRFTGVVLDTDDQPVVNAEVVAAGITNTVKTDSLGRFLVPGLKRGTLMLRVRKMGYRAYAGSVRMLVEREDTLRMPRLSQQLSPVQIEEASGYGMDVWAYKDLDQRMRWKGMGAGAISREELDEQGRAPLCAAIPATQTAGRLMLKSGMLCGLPPQCVLIDGRTPLLRSLSAMYADEVETVEYFPRKSDISGNLASRRCGSTVPTFVIWMRADPRGKKP